MAGTSTDDDYSREKSFYEEWVVIQQNDLSQLQEALTLRADAQTDTQKWDSRLSQLIEENIKHFEDYNAKRNALAHSDVSVFFAPNWCSSLENSLLWIAGCRPSTFIRLVYALCGLEIESRLAEFLEGHRIGDLGELSADQLMKINDLQSKIIREEEMLTSRMAIVQEDMADQPIVKIAERQASQLSESNGREDQALDEHARGMLRMMEEADQLRLNTLKEVLSILSPVQGVEFLAVSKRLSHRLHVWGLKRDRMHGRN